MVDTTFTNQQYENAYPDGIQYHWWQLARNQIIFNLLKRISKDDELILEIGCGRGVVVQNLRKKKLDCFGVELAEVKPINGIEKYIVAGQDCFSLCESERRKYDVILLLDVLEHLKEPLGFLKKIIEAFPGMQRIVLTLPARQELWSNYDEYYGHNLRYSLQMVESLVDFKDFKLTKVEYFFHSLYWPALLMNKFNRRRAIKIKTPSGLQKFIHHVFSRLMLLDYYLLPGIFYGSSVAGVLERSK